MSLNYLLGRRQFLCCDSIQNEHGTPIIAEPANIYIYNITGRVSGQQHCLDAAFTCGLGARCEYDWKNNFGISVEHHCLDASFPCRLEGR